MFLEELDVVPAVARTGEYHLRPFRSRGVQVIFDFDAVLLLEVRAEHGIREPYRDAYIIRPKEGVIPVSESA